MELVQSVNSDRKHLITPEGLAYRAAVGKEILLRPGFRYQPISLSHPDKNVPQVNAANYYLNPHITTNPALITGEVGLVDSVSWGSAIFLAVDPYGTIIERRVDSTDDQVVRYEQNWFITWIAGEKGATILGTSTPPFEDDMEILSKPKAKKVSWKNIPPRYWELYRRFTDSNY